MWCTHRLFGLTYALFLHLQSGGKIEGIWSEVKDHLDNHVALRAKVPAFKRHAFEHVF